MRHRYMSDVWYDMRALRRSVETARLLAEYATRGTSSLSWRNVGVAVRLAERDYDRLQGSLRSLSEVDS